MKNLAIITFFSIAFAGFMACSSDSNTQKSMDTASAETTQEVTSDNAPSNEQENSTNLAKEVVQQVSAEKPSEAEMEAAKEAAIKVKESFQKPNSESVATAKEKVDEIKKASEKVQQKQKPSVQDVSVNNPTRPATPKVETESPPPPLETKVSNETDKASATTATEKTSPVVETKPEVKVDQPPSHSDWDALLRKHVSASGKVNYKGFKSDISKLDNYLKILADQPIKSSWSRNQKMAYWINAYNAFTVKLIVDNYPVKSITNLEGGKPWDKKWIKLGGKTYSLNNIENDILRPTYKDARIHFAVNCAAKSCPPLLNKAWSASNLNSNFEKQAKAFINNASFNKVSDKEIEISKIFEWYAVDFGNIVSYINKYANSKVKSDAKVKYMEYNWELNE